MNDWFIWFCAGGIVFAILCEIAVGIITVRHAKAFIEKGVMPLKRWNRRVKKYLVHQIDLCDIFADMSKMKLESDRWFVSREKTWKELLLLNEKKISFENALALLQNP